MIIKALLLPLLPLAMLSSGAMAETTVHTKTKTEITTRTTTNFYRAIPRGSSADMSKQRMRVTYFKPTQHYYTRDNVISYRYSAALGFSGVGGAEAGSYLGPHGGAFTPDGDDLPASASVRSFASVTRRSQPGVGMAAPTPTTTKKAVSSISSPSAGVALK